MVVGSAVINSVTEERLIYEPNNPTDVEIRNYNLCSDKHKIVNIHIHLQPHKNN
jgi:hypothetical protein